MRHSHLLGDAAAIAAIKWCLTANRTTAPRPSPKAAPSGGNGSSMTAARQTAIERAETTCRRANP